jgi:hypothetical protein
MNTSPIDKYQKSTFFSLFFKITTLQEINYRKEIIPLIAHDILYHSMYHINGHVSVHITIHVTIHVIVYCPVFRVHSRTFCGSSYHSLMFWNVPFSILYILVVVTLCLLYCLSFTFSVSYLVFT